MKKIGLILLLLLLVGAFAGYYVYNMIFADNVQATETTDLYIPSNSSYDDVANLLTEKKIIKNKNSFEFVSGLMKYENVRPGYYKINPDLNNKQLVSKLRSGDQTPINLVINNARTLPELAGVISKFIESDSLVTLSYLEDESIHQKFGYNKDNFLTMFIPNTYQVFWNDRIDEIGERMHKEHDKFWSKNERLDKAKKLNLSPEEVYTLAAIVEKESAYAPERPTIAGLYLNRLKRGILLQADPTVVYANQDFTIRRVLNKHLQKDSPYNTYLYPGLPPGPITMASINAIDAVLNHKKSNYLYMCAKPGYNSEHAFATNLAEHNRNANIYRRWLSKEGIR